jgi:hypothetical protein
VRLKKPSTCKNAVAYYNVGVVFLNIKVVVLGSRSQSYDFLIYNYNADGKNCLHDAVVVEEEALEPRQVGEVVDFPDLVVGEVDRVELVQRRAQVLDQRDLVAWGVDVTILKNSSAEKICKNGKFLGHNARVNVAINNFFEENIF